MPYLGGTAQRVDPKFLMERLMRNGMSRMQAAAIVGNMQRESSLISNNLNRSEGAYGLMQWRGDRFNQLQDFAKAQGVPWTDPGVQADFVGHEMGGTERKAAQGFYRAGTIDAANAALKPYIRYSSGPAGGADQRQAYARSLYGAAPDTAPQTTAAPPATAPQPAGAQPAVSRETARAYAPGSVYGVGEPVRSKGIRGGMEEAGNAIGLALSGRANPERMQRLQGGFASLGSALSGLGLGGENPALNPTPVQSYTEPATGNVMATGLPGRYAEGAGDVLNLGQPVQERPPGAAEPPRFPGGIAPLPRSRPLDTTRVPHLDDRLQTNQTVADLMGGLVDPMTGYSYG